MIFLEECYLCFDNLKKMFCHLPFLSHFFILVHKDYNFFLFHNNYRLTGSRKKIKKSVFFFLFWLQRMCNDFLQQSSVFIYCHHHHRQHHHKHVFSTKFVPGKVQGYWRRESRTRGRVILTNRFDSKTLFGN